MDTCYIYTSQTRNQQHLTTLELEANIMRLFIAREEQLDTRCSKQTYHLLMNHTTPSLVHSHSR